MSWRRKWLGQRQVVPQRPVDGRVLYGVPDVFTGEDTTYGTVRKMTEEIRDRDWQTATEQGLAITLLAVIDDLEQVLEEREAEKRSEGSGGV